MPVWVYMLVQGPLSGDELTESPAGMSTTQRPGGALYPCAGEVAAAPARHVVYLGSSSPQVDTPPAPSRAEEDCWPSHITCTTG